MCVLICLGRHLFVKIAFHAMLRCEGVSGLAFISVASVYANTIDGLIQEHLAQPQWSYFIFVLPFSRAHNHCPGLDSDWR